MMLPGRQGARIGKRDQRHEAGEGQRLQDEQEKKALRRQKSAIAAGRRQSEERYQQVAVTPAVGGQADRWGGGDADPGCNGKQEADVLSGEAPVREPQGPEGQMQAQAEEHGGLQKGERKG